MENHRELKPDEFFQFQLERELEKLNKGVKLFKEIKPSFFQQHFTICRWGKWAPLYFYCVLPFSLFSIETMKVFVSMHFPEWEKQKDELFVTSSFPSAIHSLEYKAGELRIEFRFNSNEESSTCVLNKIGEKIEPEHIVPIYEVVCSEEAAKEFSYENSNA